MFEFNATIISVKCGTALISVDVGADNPMTGFVTQKEMINTDIGIFKNGMDLVLKPSSFIPSVHFPAVGTPATCRIFDRNRKFLGEMETRFLC